MDTEKLNIVREEPVPCRVKLNIEIPAEEVDKTFTESEKAFRQNVDIPGFRKGKAPRSLLQQKFGDKIQQEVKDRLIREGLLKAIENEEVNPLTAPNIINEEELEVTRSEDFVFAVDFDIPPQFELPDYKNIRLEKDAVEVEEDMVENVISNLLQSRAGYEKVDRPAQSGDLLKASYQGKLLENPDEELGESAKYLLEASETWLNLSPPEILPGITEKLEGAEADGKYDITIEFPEDFYETQLAGKKAEYSVHVLEVQAEQTPELTDEVAHEYGADSSGQFREMVKDRLSSEQERQEQEKLRETILDRLIGKTDFELPPEAFSREKQRVWQDVYEEKVRDGNSEDDLKQQQAELNKEVEERARNRLKRYFILDRIAGEEGIEVKDEDINRTISSLSQYYNIPAKQLLKRLKDNDGIYEVMNNIKENKTVEHLLSIADIEEKSSASEDEEKSGKQLDTGNDKVEEDDTASTSSDVSDMEQEDE